MTISTEQQSRFLPTRTVNVIGCPFSGGQRRSGVDGGPIRLVEAGLLDQLKGLGWQVEFEGHEKFEDLCAQLKGQDPDIGIMKNPRTVSAVTRSVADTVEAAAKKGSLPLTLGGDHSLALGTLTGTLRQRPEAGIIWVDAHSDINTPETTESGNLHGCPVSFLLGLQGTDVEPFNGWVKPILKPDSIVYIGLRDIDAGERRLLKENNIKCFTMHHVDRYGIGNVVDMALDHLNGGSKGKRDRPIHLSFDVDALDPTVAPSTGTPVRGGLTEREGFCVCEMLAETGCLVGVDIMEVNPSLMESSHAEQTVTVACGLARAALGETLL